MTLAQSLRDDIRNKEKYNTYIISTVQDILIKIIEASQRNKYKLSYSFNCLKENEKDLEQISSILEKKGFDINYIINNPISGCFCNDCTNNVYGNFKINWEDPQLKMRQALL